MPTIRKVTPLVAGGSNNNVLSGSQFEFLGAPSRVQIYAIQDTGGLGGVGEVEVFFGQELQYSQNPVNVKAAGPTIPDDLLVDDFGAAGDRLVVSVSETGGALGVTINTLVKITPIPVR